MATLKVAIVGGGPSAFYLTARILYFLHTTVTAANNARIHMYERLWAPYGLVRYGVAPDHPEVKVCVCFFFVWIVRVV